MLQRQEAEAEQEWEAGLSNVQLTPDGNIMPVGAALRSSKLMPVVEDEDEEVGPPCNTAFAMFRMHAFVTALRAGCLRSEV